VHEHVDLVPHVPELAQRVDDAGELGGLVDVGVDVRDAPRRVEQAPQLGLVLGACRARSRTSFSRSRVMATSRPLGS
jgi:hypothetical protein